MELDELKNTWTVLDEQLKKNEMLNKRIIQEMLYKKSSKSLSWLINMDFFSATVFLVIPFLIWLYNSPVTKNKLFPKIFCIVLIVFCILTTIWSCYKVFKYLIKIDFTKIIKDNIQLVNKYAILIKYEKIVGYYFVIPVLFLLGILIYYEQKANLFFWIFLIVVYIFATIMTYWSYKKIYDSNIQSIKKSFEELEELKD